MIRRIVFSILVIWALVDAVLTARPSPPPPSFWIVIVLFSFSLAESLFFVGLLWLLWNWVASWGKSSKGQERINKYSTTLDTPEGLVHIVTKKRWAGLLPMPHTSVMPHSSLDLARQGSLIKWTTGDAATLAAMHEAIVRLVQEFGVRNFCELRDTIKKVQRVAGAAGADWHDLLRQTMRDCDADSCPIADNVLGYMKSFV